jgi:Na+/melibiose symporter-like transporter
LEGLRRGMTPEDIQREKVKLRAAYVNGMAIGTFTTGVLSPIIAMALRPDNGDGYITLAFLITVICFALSFALHLRAMEELSRLSQ